jgi:hypothetical protein
MRIVFQPRWLALAAGAALILGAVAIVTGWPRLGPMLILASIILTILTAIEWTTPPIGASLWAQQTQPGTARYDSASGEAATGATPAHPATAAYDSSVRLDDARSSERAES